MAKITFKKVEELGAYWYEVFEDDTKHGIIARTALSTNLKYYFWPELSHKMDDELLKAIIKKLAIENGEESEFKVVAPAIRRLDLDD